VHLNCAIWHSETRFGNIDIMQPVERLDAIPLARWSNVVLRMLLCANV